MYYTAKNTQYNRLANILDKEIVLFEKKNGFAYFMVLDKNQRILAQCNANMFDKQFESVKDKPVNEAVLEVYITLKPADFKQYPKDLIKTV